MPDRPALYRRYRPQTFAQVIGQEPVTRTLRNAIAAGHVAHAYLLSGTRGTGKTSIARLIAKAVNCTKAKDAEPCDACETCVAIRDGRFLDLIEIDAASNRGIDEMRDLREKVRFAPSDGRYKVYVIDEAHQLTNEAFNALLKTLEEPPAHVIFVLATTEPQRIPATIVSRTQRFDLRRIPHQGTVQQLGEIAQSEGWTVEQGALDAISRHAQGSLRDAEGILDQVASFTGGTVTLADVSDLLGLSDWEETTRLFDALAQNDGAAGVRLVGELVDNGLDLRSFVRRAMDHTRALVLVRATGQVPGYASEAAAAALRQQAPLFTLDRLAKVAKRLIETEQQLRTGEGTPLVLELAILDLTTQAEAPSPPGARTATAQPAAGPRAAAAAPPAQRPPRSPVVDLAERRERNARADAGATQARTTAAPAATATQPAPSSPGVAISLDRVQKVWGELVEGTKARSVGAGSQLALAEPLVIEGTTVVIGFADEFARGVWSDKRRPELERDLSAALGAAVRVKCVKRPAPAGAPAVIDDPMLRAARDVFRQPERILEVE
ncbi:MAG TPA: DNA polymerase III subunit gamma/tau [Candidatus Limnocylindria bacterium]|nr:DNA polymerase III subunit gamma/tau [Candidatus Limnocylindria bacterium]